jgi:hypothetical protein
MVFNGAAPEQDCRLARETGLPGVFDRVGEPLPAKSGTDPQTGAPTTQVAHVFRACRFFKDGAVSFSFSMGSGDGSKSGGAN